MEVMPYRLGLNNKQLVIEVAGDELWGLDKVNMLTRPPQIRFIKIAGEVKTTVKQATNWNPIPQELGIVRHKAVLARIVDTMRREDTIRLINHFASKEEAGQISNGILSDDHGRAFLTDPTLGWGWRLERRDTVWIVIRYHTKRVNVLTEPTLHFSRYGSLCVPVHEFVLSVAKDFGSFVDPYSMKDYYRGSGKYKTLAGKCVYIPWIKKEETLNV